MDRTERFYKIDQLLQGGLSVSFVKLQEALGISRAQLKRDLKSGDASISALLSDPPEWVLTAKVFDLLLAVPKCGRVKAGRFLTTCRISQSKTVGGLSERQRAELVALLRR